MVGLSRPGLPHGIHRYSKTKNTGLCELEGLRMEKVGLFYGHLEYIMAFWYILWPFGNLVAIWYIFHLFSILSREKSGNPGAGRKLIYFRMMLTFNCAYKKIV
jgi:hypothetical protein